MAEHPRVPIRGSEKHPVPGAEEIGAIHPEERLEVTVHLRSRAADALVEHVRQLASRTPGEAPEPLSREAYAERFGADPADIARLETFAQANHLSVVQASAARRSVVLAGTAAAVSSAFGVSLVAFAHPDGGTFRGRQGPIYVPSDLAEVVQGVFGLDDRPAAHPHFRLLSDPTDGRHAAAGTRASFSPAQVGQLYDFPTGVNGQGQCVAIIELGGGFRKTDLTTYFNGLGIHPPNVLAVSVDHGRNAPAGPNSADGEVMLDIEVVGAVAPGATIAVYFAPNTDQGFIDAITTAVHDTTHRPSVISISWGSPEAVWTQASVQAMDQAFQAAAAMGVSVFCAAGDNGANDFPPGQGQQPGNHADFPASSPHVVGCGGTNITVANQAITNEVVWNDPGDGSTGGGYSTLFPRPTWQPAVQGQNGRGVPDVAGDASPLSGYAVRVDGQNSVIGGTSAVAPLWAGLTALLNQKLGKPLGFVNSRLYGLPSASGAFHDITVGNNNGFNAGPGWDACTGLGRPDGAKLLAALTGQAVPPSSA
jgi:kumamolisin